MLVGDRRARNEQLPIAWPKPGFFAQVQDTQPLPSLSQTRKTDGNNFSKLLSIQWELVDPAGFEPGTNGCL